MHQKKITIKDIARSANVSKSTVSRVLNNSTPVHPEKREAVLKAMKALNYRPNISARSLAGGNSMTVGVVTQNIGSPFYDSVTQGIIQAMSGSDYSPIFADGQWRPELETAAIRTLIDRNVDGLIMVGGNLEPDLLDQLRGDKPMVVVAKQLPGWEGRCLATDNVTAARKAVEYLIENGHTRIVHLMGIPEHDDAQARYQGYREALAAHGIPFNEELVITGNFSSQSGVIAIETLLIRGTPFTAIFAANDEMAYGARLALYRRAVRVPEDVSIVGFDDQPFSAFTTPPLTTMAQPALEMGKSAAELLLGQLVGETPEIPDLESRLIVRESVSRRG